MFGWGRDVPAAALALVLAIQSGRNSRSWNRGLGGQPCRVAPPGLIWSSGCRRRHPRDMSTGCIQAACWGLYMRSTVVSIHHDVPKQQLNNEHGFRRTLNVVSQLEITKKCDSLCHASGAMLRARPWASPGDEMLQLVARFQNTPQIFVGRPSVVEIEPPELGQGFGDGCSQFFFHLHVIRVQAGCGSALMNQRGPISALGMAVIWDLAVMTMVYAMGHVSGAHINPAITIALAVRRKFSWKPVCISRNSLPLILQFSAVPAYVIGQVVCGILAGLTLHGLFGEDNLRPTLTLPQPGDTPLNIIGWEFIITFTLALAVSGVATDRRAVSELVGVAVGATVPFSVLLAG